MNHDSSSSQQLVRPSVSTDEEDIWSTMIANGWIILAVDILPSLFTVIGNSIFFLTIWKTRSLHTPSNTLLGFLSIIDLMVGVVCQPLFMATLFQPRGPCCTPPVFAYNFAFFLTSWNSYLCIMLVTIDRFFAVIYPFKYLEFVSCKRMFYTAGLVFTVSTTFAVIRLLLYDESRTSFILIKVILQLIVLALVIACYGLIFREMKRQQKRIEGLKDRAGRKRRKEAKVERARTRTVALILLTYVLCTIPYSIYLVQMYLFYTKRSKFISGFGEWVNFLYLLISAMNPLIYFTNRSDMRPAAKRLLSKVSISVSQVRKDFEKEDQTGDSGK